MNEAPEANDAYVHAKQSAAWALIGLLDTVCFAAIHVTAQISSVMAAAARKSLLPIEFCTLGMFIIGLSNL